MRLSSTEFEKNSSVMPDGGPNVTNSQCLVRHPNSYSEVVPTRFLVSHRSSRPSVISAECGEEFASSNRRLLAKASATHNPQRHGELCNPLVTASDSVDDFLRCRMPPQQHGALKAHVGLSLPDFAPGLCRCAHRKIRAAAACGWTRTRAVLLWQIEMHPISST